MLLHFEDFGYFFILVDVLVNLVLIQLQVIYLTRLKRDLAILLHFITKLVRGVELVLNHVKFIAADFFFGVFESEPELAVVR